MLSTANIVSRLRRSLLVKVISRQSPSRADIASVIELTAAKLVEALRAQAITFYLLEGEHIAVRRVYYSPTLWDNDPRMEERFKEATAELMSLRLPRGRGIVGRVIETGEPIFHCHSDPAVPSLGAMAQTAGFEVHSTLTVPLKTNVILGALQVVNKEVAAGTDGEFTDADLELVQEIAEYSSALLHRMIDPKFQPTAEDTARFIARLTDLPLVETAGELKIESELVTAVGDKVIRAEGVFPFKRLGTNGVAAVMTNPLDHARREMFTRATDLHIEEVSVVSATLFEALVQQFFSRSSGPAPIRDDVNIGAVAEAIASEYTPLTDAAVPAADLEREDSAPIIQLTNRIIEDAHHCGASDIHIEPGEHDLTVRYRVDGLCQDKLRLPREAARALVARIKIMCNLDIAETRLPQDGRLIFKRYSKKGIDVDLRIAVGPTAYGEKIVMRILDKSKSALPLRSLGFTDENLARYRDCIQQPYGMILHCGPTGSGKSMTLYSALGEMNTRDVNIVTAEDPIEYTLAGVNQSQMNRQIGLTFPKALRSFLRMDPDVILVGEIRDQETAQIAVEAALTGHLLLSTLHTNDAPTTIARLTEMGIEPFNISASLRCVCAQRLVRRVCKQCRTPHQPKGRDEEILQSALGWTGPIYKASPHGCPTCSGIGYQGRIGLHELMVNSEELTEAINREADSGELKRIAVADGMKTLHQDAMHKVKLGLTTLEEALATVPPDLVKSRHNIAAFTRIA